MTDVELLTQHQNGISESAFADLVRRHLGWVYGVARRRLKDAHLAEDVAQAVFVLLHRKSPRFAADPAMMSWLYKTACYASDSAARGERRRQNRESKVAMSRPEAMQPAETPEWQELAPLLDQLIGRLPQTDREAILLRYYRDLSVADVAEQIGTNPDAARKRIERAIEKLRQLAAAKGSSLSAASLSAGLAAFIRIPPPPGLIATATTVATAPAGSAIAASTAGIVKGTVTMMASKMTIVAVTAVALVVVGGGICATVWIYSSPSSDAVAPAIANATQTDSQPTATLRNAPTITTKNLTLSGNAPRIRDDKTPFFNGAGTKIPKISPFTAIRWHGELAEVQVNGVWYHLNAVNGISFSEIYNPKYIVNDSLPQKQKHFGEDLVELLTRMGHAPGNSVKLDLQTLDAGKQNITLENVPMNEDNRYSLMNWPDPDQNSLFQAFRVVDSTPQIQESNTWYELLEINSIPGKKLVESAHAMYGDDWQKHSTIEILTTMGHPPHNDAQLKLRTLDSNEQVTMTVRMPLTN
jgi:RNA polymerase sigma factor (sigma-70 family)